MTDQRNLQNKRFIVTGAASGIGRSTAYLLAERGAALMLADMNQAECQVSANTITQNGGIAFALKADVSNEDDVQQLVSAAVSKLGGLDGAFNNAGIGSSGKPLAEHSLAEWQHVMSINLTGVFLCMKYQIEYMLENNGGAIVNTASGAGLVGIVNSAGYVASKHGVIGLSKAAAIDYAQQNIRVNAVAPGAIATPMVEAAIQDPAIEKVLAEGHPIGRLGKPEEIAEAVAWLLSDAATFVTGTVLSVDGGYTAQ